MDASAAHTKDMSEKGCDVVMTQMIRGFNDLARMAETNVTDRQTVMNPWPIIGGVAMSVRSVNAQVSDMIILIKALDTQVAVNLFQWRKRWQRIEHLVTAQDAETAFVMASESMSRLNLNAMRLVHACNQAKSQECGVDFDIHTLHE